MKKIILLLGIIISTIIFTPNSYAISYYDSVNFKTEFSEEIDLDKIDQVEIAYADQTDYTKYIILTKENNFEGVLENIPVGPINIEYGIVNDDTIGYYNVSGNIYDNYDNTLDIIISVALQNNAKNEESIDDLKKDIASTNNSSGESNSSEEEIDISNPDESTTKTTKIILESEEEIKQQEKKAASQKKNNIIGMVMFSLIGIVILIAIIYAAIKISQANK